MVTRWCTLMFENMLLLWLLYYNIIIMGGVRRFCNILSKYVFTFCTFLHFYIALSSTYRRHDYCYESKCNMKSGQLLAIAVVHRRGCDYSRYCSVFVLIRKRYTYLHTIRECFSFDSGCFPTF